MDTKTYLKYWDKVLPLMREKMESLKLQLTGQTEFLASEVTAGGDDELQVSLDLIAGGAPVLSIDFVLADAKARGEREDGVAVKLGLTGYNALDLGGYAPYNYSNALFTTDLDEVTRRVSQLDVNELAAHILNSVLTDNRLLAELSELA